MMIDPLESLAPGLAALPGLPSAAAVPKAFRMRGLSVQQDAVVSILRQLRR